MARCQDLDLYGFPLVGLTGREAAAIAVRADDGKRMQRWRRQVSPSPWPAGSLLQQLCTCCHTIERSGAAHI